MKPIIALVGRPNVGKSTLFNRLTRSRAALVADFPGLTRDRHYGEGRMGDTPFLVIDTGGFEPVAKDGILYEMARQTRQAVAEADIVIFILDGRQGLTSHDINITNYLRKANRSVLVAVNKAEGMKFAAATAEFYELGLGEPYVISAAHGDGIAELLEGALHAFSSPHTELENEENQDQIPQKTRQNSKENSEARANSVTNPIKIAVVGRPNAGKSTLINTLLGEERVIAFDQPGTTRDAVHIPFEKDGTHYILIDTAGIRRRGKVFEAIEKFSVVKTLQAISEANVVLLLLDANQDIAEQDAHIAGFILESGRALVVGVNKWDALPASQRNEIKIDIERKLNFLNFAKFHFISALKSTGISSVIKSINAAYAAALANLSTPKLTRALITALEHQQPARKRGVRPKLRYAHQGGKNPPVIVIHGNSLEAVDAQYKRYLEKHFREAFSLVGTPLRIELRSGKNPYDKKE